MRLASFQDFVGLLREQAVSLPMGFCGSISVWGIRQAEDRSFLLVYPELEELYPILVLDLQVLLVGSGYVLEFRPFEVPVDIDVSWHATDPCFRT